MSNYVIDDAHNKIAGYSKDETDAAIAAGGAANVETATINISAFSAYNIKLVRIGKVVTMQLPPINSLTSGSAVLISQDVPTGFIPYQEFTEEFLDAAARRFRIVVTTSGNITLRVYSQDIAASNSTYKNFTWIAA